MVVGAWPYPLEGDRADGFGGASGNGNCILQDVSGNGYDGTFDTSNTLYNAVEPTELGCNCVFTGSGGATGHTPRITLPDMTTHFGSEATLITLVDRRTTGNNGSVFGFGTGGSNDHFAYSNTWYQHIFNNSNRITVGSVGTTNFIGRFDVAVMARSGADWAAWAAGKSVNTGSTYSFSMPTAPTLMDGHGGAWTGRLMGVILLNKALNNEDVLQMRNVPLVWRMFEENPWAVLVDPGGGAPASTLITHSLLGVGI